MELHAGGSRQLHGAHPSADRRFGYLRAEMPAAKRTPPPTRIHIQYPQPVVDAGRYPAKRTVGDLVEVSCDVFRDGHEKLRAVAVLPPRRDAQEWAEAELHPLDAHHNGVRWGGSFVVDELGSWEFSIHAWTDVFATWRDEFARKLEAGQDQLASELSEARRCCCETSRGARRGRRPQADRARAARARRRRRSSSAPSTTPRSGPSSTPRSSAAPSATA